MAELADGAALLVPPGDVDALASALEAAIDEGRHTTRRAQGLRTAGERTWESSVDQHVHAYAVARAASQ